MSIVYPSNHLLRQRAQLRKELGISSLVDMKSTDNIFEIHWPFYTHRRMTSSNLINENIYLVGTLSIYQNGFHYS